MKHTPSQHVQHLGRSALFAILAAISFALMSLLGKIIGDRASTDTVLFARFSVSFILLLPWVIRQPLKAIQVEHPKKLIFRSCFLSFLLPAFFTPYGTFHSAMHLFSTTHSHCLFRSSHYSIYKSKPLIKFGWGLLSDSLVFFLLFNPMFMSFIRIL